MSDEVAAAAARVDNFLLNHEGRTGVDPELLYGVHAREDLPPGELRVSDLRTLVEHARCGTP